MTTDIEENKSRWSVLSDIKTELEKIASNQERLERHMITLTKATTATRQMSEEDRETAVARFPADADRDRPAAGGRSRTRATMAAGDFDKGHGGAGQIGAVLRHFDEFVFRGRLTHPLL